MSQLFAWGGQSTGVSALVSFLPKNTPGLISFRMDWLDLLAVQGTLKSLLQHHSSKASILQLKLLEFFLFVKCHITWLFLSVWKTYVWHGSCMLAHYLFIPVNEEITLTLLMHVFIFWNIFAGRNNSLVFIEKFQILKMGRGNRR